MAHIGLLPSRGQLSGCRERRVLPARPRARVGAAAATPFRKVHAKRLQSVSTSQEEAVVVDAQHRADAVGAADILQPGDGVGPQAAAAGTPSAEISTSVTEIWRRNTLLHGDQVAVVDPHHQPGYQLTYRQLEAEMHNFGAGLQALGLQRGDKVALFAENSVRWIVADQGIMMGGAVDVVRGSVSPVGELAYILEHSDSTGAVLQDTAALKKLLAGTPQAVLAQLRFVVVLWPDAPDSEAGPLADEDRGGLPPDCAVLSYARVLGLGAEAQQLHGSFQPAAVSTEEVATLVYTSGTTGKPKGVMLTHGNLVYQVKGLPQFVDLTPGANTLSLLPPWHIYERTTSYYIYSRGCRQVCTNIRKFRDDLAKYPPDYFVCVPLVLESLHHKITTQINSAPPHRRAIAGFLIAASVAFVQARRILEGAALQFARAPAPPLTVLKAHLVATLLRPFLWLAQALVFKKIRQAIGIRKLAISGGGSLAAHLDDFFEAMGLGVLNGWGLTETSPVLACRTTRNNVRGTVGVPMGGTELRVVDPVTRAPVAEGAAGLVLARGPGVMRGYYKDEAATAAAFPEGDGWFDTGDLGWQVPASGGRMAGQVVLTGRCKDTIVLSSGKNVEPQPIEDALTSSPLIKHAMVVGQDKRELGVVLFPALPEEGGPEEAARQQLEQQLVAEVAALNSTRMGYHAHEHIAHVKVVWAALSVEDGTLTRTMKPRRAAITSVYSAPVEALLGKLRA